MTKPNKTSITITKEKGSTLDLAEGKNNNHTKVRLAKLKHRESNLAKASKQICGMIF